MNQDRFTQQILGALQLDACQQAQMLLDDYEKRSLPSLHEELTRQHLKSCEDCRALHAKIVRINARLPALKSLRAPQGFTGSVMRKTAYRKITPQREQEKRRVSSWLLRPRFALESAYAMTVMMMLFSGLTGVNAFDATLWEQAHPRLVEPPVALQEFSDDLKARAAQQSDRIATTYDITTQAIHTWTQEKYSAFTERFSELLR